jgi:hypothetical protein
MKNIEEGVNITSTPLACPPITKTTISEEIDEIIQIRDSESETLDVITIPTEKNGQSSIISPKNTENKN